MTGLFGVLLVLATGSAEAGDVEVAEHARLSAELAGHAHAGDWVAAEADFRGLSALEAKGEVLGYEDRWLGAQAAAALGDRMLARTRVAAAVRLDPREEALGWLAATDAGWGRVEVRTAPGSTPELVSRGESPDPWAGAAVARANAWLKETGAFSGLLPVGEYAVGDTGFRVEPGDRTVRVDVGPVGVPGAGGIRVVAIGPRAELGAVYGGMAPSAAESAIVEGFAGPGFRAALGIEVVTSAGIGVAAEVGYLGAFGQPTEPPEEFVTVRPALHLWTGWLALSYRVGRVAVSAGPELLAGSATSNIGYQGLVGSIATGGVAAQVGVDLARAGAGSLGVVVSGGVGLGEYLFPWGSVGLALHPRSAR